MNGSCFKCAHVKCFFYNYTWIIAASVDSACSSFITGASVNTMISSRQMVAISPDMFIVQTVLLWSNTIAMMLTRTDFGQIRLYFLFVTNTDSRSALLGWFVGFFLRVY